MAIVCKTRRQRGKGGRLLITGHQFTNMYPVFLLLILVYFNVEISSRDIEVMNSGLMKIRKEDMIVVFFVTIRHHGEKARNVMATMVECCEKITDDDTDCDLIQLHGEHLGVLQPGTTLNVTFLYPNFYGYNRKGSCVIDIWNRGEGSAADDTDEIRHKIEFDTTIKLASEEVPPFLQGLYNPEKVVRCDTTDLDPFDGCNPVDCRLKYSGLRNYFNRKRKRCQKVPTCVGDPNKDLPDVVYVPMSNTCRNLEKVVTEDDIKALLNHRYDGGGGDKTDLEPKMVNIQCHHGEIDVKSGLCICDKGWTSEPFDADAYNEGTSVYHMCDKKCHPDSPSRLKATPFFIGVAVALWVFFVVVLCENCDFFCEFYRRQEGEEEEVCYFPVSGAEN